MYCEKCGKEIQNGAKFCGGCGKAVGNEENRNAFMDKENSVSKMHAIKKTKINVMIVSTILAAVAIVVGVSMIVPKRKSEKSNDTVFNRKQKIEQTTQNRNETETEQDGSMFDVPDISGDLYDSRAIELYQEKIGHAKCNLFYINGCDVPVCAYKSEENENEILLFYNKNTANVDVFEMEYDSTVYHNNDIVFFHSVYRENNSTIDKYEAYSVLSALGGGDGQFDIEGWGIFKIIHDDGQITYGSGQEQADKEWYNDTLKKYDDIKTIEYSYDTVEEAYKAIDKTELYVRKALNEYSNTIKECVGCTLIYPSDDVRIPMCVYEDKSGEQHLIAYVDGRVSEISAMSKNGTVNYNHKTNSLRMDSSYEEMNRKSSYCEFYTFGEKGFEYQEMCRVDSAYKDDGDEDKIGFTYSSGNITLTEDEYNEHVADYGDSNEFKGIFCDYYNVYYAYSSLVKGEDTEKTWKQIYSQWICKNDMDYTDDSDEMAVFEDINNDEIPELFCRWEDEVTKYSMYYIDGSGDVKELFDRKCTDVSVADGYVKGGAAVDLQYYERVYRYNKSTGNYDNIFKGNTTCIEDMDNPGYKYHFEDKECSEEEYKGRLDKICANISFRDVGSELSWSSRQLSELLRNYYSTGH